MHVEWSSPVEKQGRRKSQALGNSGIFLMGIYEFQVLNSYQNPTYFDGQAGAIYKQVPPAVNAMRPPGQWNSYDIFWTAPRFDDDGELLSPAYITALHNGVLIQNHFEVKGDTPYTRPPSYKAHAPRGPIKLQDHRSPVRFRNIWVRDYQSAQVKQPN
ncbi:multi-domain protein [Rhodopirellula maiorica SM1]|uniref:Multi-domain protein n=1 Tax=Rhodopirellula maiorica SM1 TaxID=1265738 RepID=M5S2E3_9BACT|nr:multi-domain protein [Rhodopirellula maiorica SM1]